MSATRASTACVGQALEQLTNDHRVRVSSRAELSRAARSASIRSSRSTTRRCGWRQGDVLRARHRRRATSIVERALHRPTPSTTMRGDLDAAARRSSSEAFERGSEDNLTVQIVRVDALPTAERERSASASHRSCRCRRCSKPRMVFDGYRIVRELHASSRSHVYPGRSMPRPTRRSCIKTPSIDLRDDAALPGALPDGRLGRAAHQQRARAEAAARGAQAQLSLRRHRIRRRPDAARNG